MKKIGLSVGALALLAGLLLFTACSKSNGSGGDTATVNFHLTDAPSSIYSAVNVDIQQIEIQSNADGSWTSLPLIRPGIYNLLSFRNGMDTLLSRATLPVGTLSQIRLVLGTNNSVIVNGSSYSLSTPSAQQSGLKLNLHQSLEANGAYDIWLDFDAGRSVVQTGNGGYSLKPVIRTYSALVNGQIKGYILPLTANAIVYAINSTDTLSAIPASVDGFFMFSGLQEGNYKLWIQAGSGSGLSDTIIDNVPVVYGQISNVNTITLQP